MFALVFPGTGFGAGSVDVVMNTDKYNIHEIINEFNNISLRLGHFLCAAILFWIRFRGAGMEPRSAELLKKNERDLNNFLMTAFTTT